MLTVQVSPQRARTVVREISAGSKTHLRFYAMLIASCMIACFGLLANSTAVVIGAMLVSPLMTPIFGIALGLLRGNPRLLVRAFTTELVGVALAVGSAYLLGLTHLTAGEATAEMLTRTQPNLMDLMVAVFAGFAGAYALVDERISPALPGVAIATAIVPPLATCGLCLALGASSGALGAMLLFLANFVSILLVSLVTFAIAGLTRSRIASWTSLARQFVPALAAFVIMATILTDSLERILHDRMVGKTIRVTLIEELAEDHGSDLEEFIYKAAQEKVQVLATVRSHRTVPPGRVSDIQESLQASLESPVELVIRTVRSRDVSAIGTSLQVVRPDLNGTFLTEQAEDPQAREALATQVLREQYEQEPGFELTRLEYGTTASGSAVVVAYVNTIRRLAVDEIAAAEACLQQRMNDTSLNLLMRVNSSELKYSGGPVLVEWTNWGGASAAEVAQIPKLERAVREAIADVADVTPINVHFNYQNGQRRILAEVAGPNPVSPQDAALVRNRVVEQMGHNTEIYLWYRNEFVVNDAGYSTYEKLTAPMLHERSQDLHAIFGTEEEGGTTHTQVTPKPEGIAASVSLMDN